MTFPRRQRKHCAGRLVAALAVIFVVLSEPWPAPAATTEQLVTDRNTGLAISGFDPVAYFVDHLARPGSGDFECVLAGAIWRFRNAGNRAAFLAHPDVYMPRFGGYDPVAIARGVAVAGHPEFWAVVGGRLYLFYDLVAQAEFVLDAERLAATAERKWPAVQQALVP